MKRRSSIQFSHFFCQLSLFAIASIGIIPLQALSMEFNLVERFGQTVVSATGPIRAGDAERLQRSAEKADVLAHGFRILELDSPGGSVEAALDVASVIHQEKFHTLIPNGSTCASACGAVLFVAGHLRTIENGGRLGMHTCYDGQTSVSLETCNERIAQYAFSRGVAHGSVHAYMSAVPPDAMYWFDRESAECNGLTRYYLEDRQHYSAISPCWQKALFGATPDPVMRWRVKRKDGGFVAFVRSYSDYEEVAQTEIFCKESKPGIIHLSATFLGGNDTSETKFEKMRIHLDDKLFETSWPAIDRKDNLTVYTYELPRSEVVNLLKEYKSIIVDLEFAFDSNPFSFGAELGHGRKALLFAANHCVR